MSSRSKRRFREGTFERKHLAKVVVPLDHADVIDIRNKISLSGDGTRHRATRSDMQSRKISCISDAHPRGRYIIAKRLARTKIRIFAADVSKNGKSEKPRRGGSEGRKSVGREGLPVRCVFLLNPFHNGAISASGWPGADPGRFRTRPADGSPGGVGSRLTGRRRRRP